MLHPVYAVLLLFVAVMWTDFLWLLDYLPSTGSGCRFNIAIGSGGTFDWQVDVADQHWLCPVLWPSFILLPSRDLYQEHRRYFINIPVLLYTPWITAGYTKVTLRMPSRLLQSDYFACRMLIQSVSELRRQLYGNGENWREFSSSRFVDVTEQ